MEVLQYVKPKQNVYRKLNFLGCTGVRLRVHGARFRRYGVGGRR